MLDEFLSMLNDNQRKELTKCAIVFAGGVIAGFAIKNVWDSIDFDNIKDNAISMIDDINNSNKTSVDMDLQDYNHENNNLNRE